MLVVLTQLAVFRISLAKVEKSLAKGVHRTVITMNYPAAIELIAFLNGESVSKQLLYDAVHRLYPVGEGALEAMSVVGLLPEETLFSFACPDGLFQSDYSARALGKHFTNIENFASTFPGQSMPMSQTTNEVEEAIQAVMIPSVWGDDSALLSDARPIIDVLGPSSDLYYLFFDLEGMAPSFFSTIIVTEEERSRLREVHDVQTRIARGDLRGTYLFNEVYYYTVSAPNPSPFCLFHTFSEYLSEDWDRSLVIFPSHPSYLFWNYILHGQLPTVEMLTHTFDDDSGILDDAMAESLSRSLLTGILTVPMTYREVVRVLTMVGIRSPLLQNEETEVYAPYQITSTLFIPRSLMEDVVTVLAAHRVHSKAAYTAALQYYITEE